MNTDIILSPAPELQPAALFTQNFAKFAGQVSEAVRRAGPRTAIAG